MDGSKIKVVKIGSAGAVGTPEDFEKHFERKNKPRQTSQVHKPTLTPVENLSMQERLDNLGLER